MKKGFLIDGLQVFEEYKSIQRFGLIKLKLSILVIKRGFHIDGLQVYEEYKRIQEFVFGKLKALFCL